MKRCAKCGTEYPDGQFARRRSGWSYTTCLTCRSDEHTSNGSVSALELIRLESEGWEASLPSAWRVVVGQKKDGRATEAVVFTGWQHPELGVVWGEASALSYQPVGWFAAKRVRLVGKAPVFSGRRGPFERIGLALDALRVGVAA